MDELMDGRLGEWIDGWIDGLLVGQLDRWLDGCLDGSTVMCMVGVG